MTDAPPQFVTVASLYDARSRAGTRMLAGHTDATHAGVWQKAQFYIFDDKNNPDGRLLYAKTPEHPELTFACRLELRHSTSGTPILFGVWAGTRIYIFEQEAERHAKDCLPDFELCIRVEDYFANGGAAPTTNGEE